MTDSEKSADLKNIDKSYRQHRKSIKIGVAFNFQKILVEFNKVLLYNLCGYMFVYCYELFTL